MQHQSISCGRICMSMLRPIICLILLTNMVTCIDYIPFCFKFNSRLIRIYTLVIKYYHFALHLATISYLFSTMAECIKTPYHSILVMGYTKNLMSNSKMLKRKSKSHQSTITCIITKLHT